MALEVYGFKGLGLRVIYRGLKKEYAFFFWGGGGFYRILFVILPTPILDKAKPAAA